jgi:hypothetical protein
MRWLLVLLVACSSRHEGDIPLRVTNPPTCPAGKTPANQVVLRLEHGGDYVEQAISDKMIAANTWAGRSATVKLALCPLGESCTHPVWIRTAETTVRGDDHGLELDLPSSFELPCNDAR